MAEDRLALEIVIFGREALAGARAFGNS